MQAWLPFIHNKVTTLFAHVSSWACFLVLIMLVGFLAAQYCGNSAILYAAVGLALIANIFGFKTREFFQLEEGEAAARQPVKVQF